MVATGRARTCHVGRYAKIVGALLMSWWLPLLIGFGLFANGYMALLAFRAGATMAALVLTVCFCGAVVYLYRTFKYRDEYRAIFKD
jgi:hypothetical protein